MQADDAVETADNVVHLRGRLADLPERRDLPSGDVLLSFRLTVPRPPGERVRVDSLECVAVRPAVRRVLERAAPGDRLEVQGSLQRRFWRGPSGPASRYCVSVVTLRRLKPLGATGSAAAAPAGAALRARRRAGA